MERPRSIKRLYDLLCISDGFWYRLKLLCVYILLYSMRKVGRRPYVDNVTLGFRYKGKSIRYLVCTQLDFDVFWDSLVVDQYTLPTVEPLSVRTIFDLGSNIGTTVVAFYHKFPEARIYAFEPDPHNFKRLSAHVALLGPEGKTRVKLFHNAIADTHGDEVSFYIGTKDHWSSSLQKRSVTSEEVLVKTVTIDRICEEEQIEQIDILKMDIEGAEESALDGFGKLPIVTWFLGEMHPTLMCGTIKDFINRFSGFSIVSLDTKTGVFVMKNDSFM